MVAGLDPSLPSAGQTGTRVKKKAVPKLLNLLSPVVHSWTLFARQIGVPTSRVSLIRAANPPAGLSYLHTCFTQTLEWWVNNHHNPTYEAIIAILDPKRGQTTSVMNRALAREVEQFMAKQQRAIKPSVTSGTHGDLGGQFPIEPSLTDFGSETFQQPCSDEYSASSQEHNEGLISPNKLQELDTLSGVPQKFNTATSTPVQTLQVKPQQEDVGNIQPTDSSSQVFRQFYADMMKAIQDPDGLAAELYSTKIILSSTRDEVTQSIILTREQKNSKLLAAVECQLPTNHEAFKVFLSALKKQEPLASLCTRMEEACTVSASIFEPNSSHQFQALHKFKPNFFTKKSHCSDDYTMFPYLKMTDMSEKEKDLLQRKLLKDTNTIMSEYADVIHYTIKSLSDNPDVTVETLSSRVSSLGAYKPVYAQKPLLRDKLEEIDKCSTIDGVFCILLKYCSFFNYGIIQKIVMWFGKPEDKARLEKYTEHFKQFCKRRIAECPPDVYGHQSDGRSNLVVKTEDSWDPRGETQGIKLQQALDLENFIVEILGLEPETLHLCRIDDCCMELLFQVPSFVEEDIFPLSVEQERALTSVGVARLTCGRYKFPPEDSGNCSGLSDILSHLPLEIAIKILQYLDPLDLCQVPLVCQKWYNLLSQDLKLKMKRIKYIQIHKLDEERLSVLLKHQEFITKIGVVYHERHQQKAVAIAEHLRSKNIPALLLKYSNWPERASEYQCTHFIVISMANMTWPVQLNEFMEERKLSSTVVVIHSMPLRMAQKKESGCLERFLKLDYREGSALLAEAALAHFLAPPPKACEEDNCYWSAEPELVDLWTEEDSRLSDVIMMAEMALGSPFETIVLSKEISDEYFGVLYDHLGTYTHIQSINGILLDGLTLEKATEIFNCLAHPRIQIVVRTFYSVTVPTKSHFKPRQLPTRPSLPIQSFTENMSECNTSKYLPTPLFIVGNNFHVQNKLFELLSNEDPLPCGLLPHEGIEMQLFRELSESDECIQRAAVPVNKFKVDTSSLNLNQPRLFKRPQNIYPQTEVQLLSSLKSKTSGHKSSHSITPDPVDLELASILSSEMNFSDTKQNFSEHSRNDDATSKFDLTTQDVIVDNEMPQDPYPKDHKVSTRPQIGEQQFILHMLKKDVDRRFAHIFLKSSGIYLVIVCLDDILGDPLMQYEDLFYWLRLIQTNVSPDRLKRVIVVGMYHKSKVQKCSDLILQCVQHLNTAIQDQMKQNFSLPTEEKGFIFMFNLDNAPVELQYLCACIKSLMDDHIDQAWWYFQGYFESTFLPFETYQKVCIQLSALAKEKVVESSKNILQLSEKPVPKNYFETIAAYTTGCIDSEGDSLLCPSFIPELFMRMKELQHYQVDMVLPPFLKSLPIISSSLLSDRMAALGVVEHKDQVLLLKWLKQFEFAYGIGMVKDRGEGFLFPLLATGVLSDSAFFRWDPNLEAQFDSCPVVLYALLHIPATEHFYHQLIASLLSTALKSPQLHTQPCFINKGCNEAILPLQYEEGGSPQNNFHFQVLLKYHFVQNIIEFRTRVDKPLLLVMKAVESSLYYTFLHSKHHHTFRFKEIFSLHIPAEDFEQAFKEGPIWKLGNVEFGSADSDSDAIYDQGRLDILLKTRPLIQPGKPDPQKCTAVGQGLAYGETKQVTQFQVYLVDVNNQLCTERQEVTAELKSLVNSLIVKVSVVFQSPAIYGASYEPNIRGRHELSVSVNGLPISGSPFKVYVQQQPQLLRRPVSTIKTVNAGRIIATSNNQLIVSGHGEGIRVFNAKWEVLKHFCITGPPLQRRFFNASGFAVDDDSNFFVSDWKTNGLLKLNHHGELLKFIGGRGKRLGQFHKPDGIKLRSNKVFVCDRNNCRIQIFDTELNFISCFGSPGTRAGQFNWPTDLAFDLKGNIYVADLRNHRVQVFSSDAEILRSFGRFGHQPGDLNKPCCIHVDLHYVYVTEQANRRVSVFTTSGKFVTCFGIGNEECSVPVGITMDQDGYLYVCDFNCGIQKF